MRIKQLKRYIALFMVVWMVVSSLDLSGLNMVKAEETKDSYGTVVATGKTGNVTYTIYDTSGGNSSRDLLVFSGTGEIYSSGKANYVDVKKIIIEYGVTAINGGCFQDNTNLTSVEIKTNENGETSLNKIYAYAFYNDTNLTSMNFPKGIKSIGDYAFSNTNLSNVILPEGFEILYNDAFQCTSGTRESMIVPSTATSVGSGSVSGYEKAYYLGTSTEIEGNNPTNSAYKLTLEKNGATTERYVLPAEVAKGTVYEGTKWDASVGFPFDEDEISASWTKNNDNDTKYTVENKAEITGDTTFHYSSGFDRRTVTFNLTNLTTDGENVAKGGEGGEDYVCTLTPDAHYQVDSNSIRVTVGESILEKSEYTITSDYTIKIPKEKITGNIIITANGMIDESQYVVSLKTNGETKKYFSFKEAAEALGNGSGTLTLLKDCSEGDVELGGNATLDLNGHCLDFSRLFVYNCTIQSSIDGGRLNGSVRLENSDSNCKILSGTIKEIIWYFGNLTITGGTIEKLTCNSGQQRSDSVPTEYGVMNPETNEKYTRTQFNATDFSNKITPYQCTEHEYEKGYCKYCNLQKECDHKNIDVTTGICKDCQIQMTASITSSENAIYCENWKKLITEASNLEDNKNYTIQMYTDVNVIKEEVVNLEKGILTLDLGGHTINNSAFVDAPFRINGGNVTIKNGTLVGNSRNRALDMYAGTLQLESTLTLKLEGGVYVNCLYIKGGTTVINGTTIENSGIDISGGEVTINAGLIDGVMLKSGSLKLNGGTYRKSSISVDAYTGKSVITTSELKNLLADGYAFRKVNDDGSLGEWILDDETLSGKELEFNVEVEKLPQIQITKQPESKSVKCGQEEILSIEAIETTANRALTYQWYLKATDGKDTPVEGATASTFTLPDPRKDISRTYYCVISCEGCSVSSEEATVNWKHDHIDEDGNGKCDICNIFMDNIGTNLIGYSLSLSGNIGVNFYMELSENIAKSDTAYVFFSLPNGTTSKVYVNGVHEDGGTATTTNLNGITYYVFTCEVAAKEMTATIKAQMIERDEKGTEYTYTVKDYADYILKHADSFGDNTVALVKAMLNYGGNAQQYFEYNKTDLANAQLTEEEKNAISSVTNDIFDGYKAVITSNPEVCTFASSYLSLKSQTDLYVYVKLAEGIDPENTTFTITQPDGKELTNLKASELTVENNKCYKLSVKGVPAHKLSNMYTFKVTTGSTENEQTATLNYGVYSYCQTAMSESFNSVERITQLRNTLKAMYQYEQATNTYRGNE